MSKAGPTTWFHRKAQLQTLLDCNGDDEEEGIALDRLLHGQAVIGRTQKSNQIDNIRFSDKDLNSFGPLAEAQFGQVELVSCRIDGRVYVRKRVSKKFALKTREQFSPQTERHIFLLALKAGMPSSTKRMDPAVWTPRMLCSYQCSSFLNIVMEYAAGGSLWDVLESSSAGRLAPADLAWWAPQCVAALGWLHSHCGYAHRDVKPHNFVLRPDARLLLIDFGSAAPLLLPGPDGAQRVPREFCLVPCGTCDYISPEILQAHEEALVALEMSDDEDGGSDSDGSGAGIRKGWKAKNAKSIIQGDMGYGRETDWWSLGAMLYELAYGVAPFFANDIRQTYLRIVEHKTSLKFNNKVPVPTALVNLIKGLLTHSEDRLGRNSVDEIKRHAYFKDVHWSTLHTKPAPHDLLLPQFTYATPLVPPQMEDDNTEDSADASKPFAFSALFQSSVSSRPTASPGLSHLQNTLSTPAFGRRSLSRSSAPGTGSAHRSIASFIGFSWGPPRDAFDDAMRIVPAEPASASPGLLAPSAPSFYNDASIQAHPLITPMRPVRGGLGTVPPSTVRVTSVRRSAQARPVSDREAMRLLVDCVGMSARKRVLESGKKPKVLLPQFGFAPPPPELALTMGAKNERMELGMGRPRAGSYSRSVSRSSVINAVRKELRFDETTTQIMASEPNTSYSNMHSGTGAGSSINALGESGAQYLPYPSSDASMSSGTEGPPSPSPSPRPGSAMSMLSMSRRSATPTLSSVHLTGSGLTRSSSEPPEVRPRLRASSVGENRYGDVSAMPDERHPTTWAAKKSTPRRTRFADPPVQTPKASSGRVQSTPHPRRNLPPTPDTEPRPRFTHSGTPARPKVGRRKSNSGMDSDTPSGAKTHGVVQSWGDSGGELAASDSGTETEDRDHDEPEAEVEAEAPSRNPSPPAAAPRLEYGDGPWLELYDDMERRYTRLLADIANVKTRIDRFVADVRYEEWT
ncbi:hypothetical protein M0805_004517 [Coniferiporia weirii]|nr:hypothetical protein M0805_004517 [Coniferiporia weirii]